MSVLDAVGANATEVAPTLDLDEIQATVLRPRPAPYVGVHILFRVDDAKAGRAFIGRLAPHIESAADWWKAHNAWIAIGISYAGLEALGVPEASLQSFPEAFRQGMAARAKQLGDFGLNGPENWEPQFRTREAHIGISVFSDSKESFDRVMAMARAQYEGFSGAAIVSMQNFGAQPGDRNSLGYKDGIDQPAVEGSGVDPLPGQGEPIKAGEFILGYPGESGAPLPTPQPEVLGRNGTFVGFRKYQSRVGAFNRFLHASGATADERELVAAKLVGRWRSGAPLALAPETDDPALGADSQRNNDFTYADDPHGRKIPYGAHIRRMNPRDSHLTRLTDVKIHRVIRRGSTYGPPYRDDDLSEEADVTPRGAYFLFISAKAMTTMEFLQKEWINEGQFVELGDERDPIIGLQQEGAVFTVPQQPVRRRLHGLETFNVLRGGDYFFMPSLSALNWLANLSG